MKKAAVLRNNVVAHPDSAWLLLPKTLHQLAQHHQ
jgi:hypothetical protein